MELLAGTRIVIETTVTPPIEINLDDAVHGEPSAATKFLQPKLTLFRGDVQLLQRAPHGDPASSPPWGTIFAVAAVVAVLLVVLRRLS